MNARHSTFNQAILKNIMWAISCGHGRDRGDCPSFVIRLPTSAEITILHIQCCNTINPVHTFDGITVFDQKDWERIRSTVYQSQVPVLSNTDGSEQKHMRSSVVKLCSTLQTSKMWHAGCVINYQTNTCSCWSVHVTDQMKPPTRTQSQKNILSYAYSSGNKSYISITKL